MSSAGKGKGKRKVILNTVAVDLGCGGVSCRRPRKLLSAIFHPKPKPTDHHHHYRKHNYNNPYFTKTTASAYYTSSSSSTPYDSSAPTTAATFSPTAEEDEEEEARRTVQGFGRVGGESVAVEKDSNDPYLDFRQSMLQMILEKEIYSKEELRELLNCFLQLNSPYHHGIIVRAFSEIWNSVLSVKPPAAGYGGSTSKAPTTPPQRWGQYYNYNYNNNNGW